MCLRCLDGVTLTDVNGQIFAPPSPPVAWLYQERARNFLNAERAFWAGKLHLSQEWVTEVLGDG